MHASASASFEHTPVLLQATIEYIRPKPGGIYVDATLGGGGHSEQIARRIGPEGTLVGIDQDAEAIKAARERLSKLPPKIHFVHDNFTHLGRILGELGIERVDGVLFDLGVSSPQLDHEERGFSYQVDAPLDMRMDRRWGQDASWLVNNASEQELARIIREYGEERWASRVAAEIVRTRREQPIRTTGELVDVVKRAIPAPARRSGPHPARRTFQALRIAVNRELEALEQALPQAIEALAPHGRLVVISFHSLEDRIVKRVLQTAEKPCICPSDFPVCRCGRRQTLRILTRRPVVADQEEIQKNPRARSAKLRAAERVLSPGEGE